jgi:putative membrane protein
MKWLIGIFINAILFMAIAGYFQDSFYLAGFGSAVAASFILSVLNILVRPILIILTLPITIITLGFFLFVVNAITLTLTDSIMGADFEINGFGMAFMVAVTMSIVNLIIQKTLLENKKKTN